MHSARVKTMQPFVERFNAVRASARNSVEVRSRPHGRRAHHPRSPGARAYRRGPGVHARRARLSDAPEGSLGDARPPAGHTPRRGHRVTASDAGGDEANARGIDMFAACSLSGQPDCEPSSVGWPACSGRCGTLTYNWAASTTGLRRRLPDQPGALDELAALLAGDRVTRGVRCSRPWTRAATSGWSRVLWGCSYKVPLPVPLPAARRG